MIVMLTKFQYVSTSGKLIGLGGAGLAVYGVSTNNWILAVIGGAVAVWVLNGTPSPGEL